MSDKGNNYYAEQRKVNRFLEDKFNLLRSRSISSLDTASLVRELTLECAVSRRYVEKRVEFLLSFYPNELKSVDGVISLVE